MAYSMHENIRSTCQFKEVELELALEGRISEVNTGFLYDPIGHGCLRRSRKD